jgi:amino acid transporter
MADRMGVPPTAWTTGAWVDAGRALGGWPLACAIVVGGMVCGIGMMDALVLSYSRLPMAMALDGYLPRIFARQIAGTGAPWFSILVLSAAWSTALGLGFERLIELDVILYGLALLLEFVALVVLRIREPSLDRPFRVPGGLAVAALLGVGPLALLCLALAHEWRSQAHRSNAIAIGAALVIAGPVVYGIVARVNRSAQI